MATTRWWALALALATACGDQGTAGAPRRGGPARRVDGSVLAGVERQDPRGEAPGADVQLVLPPLGAVVRLRGAALHAQHLADVARGRSREQRAAAAAERRGALEAQHRRVRGALEAKLGRPLAARRSRGPSFEDRLGVLNALVLRGVAPGTIADALAGHPDVLAVEPIVRVTASLTEAIPWIDADDVWTVGDAAGLPLDGRGVRIGVLDTGVDYTHPDLGGCLGPGCKIAGGHDFVNDDPDPMDDHGHGTHVAATAAGDGLAGAARLRGVAPAARLWAYKVLDATGAGDSADVIAGVERCADPDADGDTTDHLDVCTMSLGAWGNPDDAMSAAVDSATAAGVVFTVAAGNRGPSAQTIDSPGTARRAITVAAACKPSKVGVDSRCAGPIASFSSRGPVVWTAGGVQQTLAKPDVAAPGLELCAAEWGTYQSGARCLDARHVSLSGTSMATPVVAGAAALLLQAHPELTPQQVKDALVAAAAALGADATAQGSGRVAPLAALSRLGVPAPVARFGGPALLDVDDPVARRARFSSDVTVTNPTDQELTYRASFTGVAGMTATVTPAELTLAPGAIGTLTVAREIDHDVAPSGVEATGTVTLSSARGDAALPVTIGVRDRLRSTPAVADLGVDLASRATWDGSFTVTLVNTRLDAPATYAAAVSCCSFADGSAAAGITATVSPSVVTLEPGGSAAVTLTLTADNARITRNAALHGTLTFASPLQSATVPVRLFKGYGLELRFGPDVPYGVSLWSTATATTFVPTERTMTMLLDRPGPYFVEAAWRGTYPTLMHHVVVPDVATDVPVRAVTLEKAAAIHAVELRPVDRAGARPTALNTIYRLTHAPTGGGTIVSTTWETPRLLVSPLPGSFDFTAASVTRSADEILGFLYDLQGGVDRDLLLTNAAGELVTHDVKVFPAAPSGTGYLLPLACLNRYHSDGTTIRFGGGDNCWSNQSYAAPVAAGGIARAAFHRSGTRDPSAGGPPDAPTVRFELEDGKASGPAIFSGPQLYVTPERVFSWHLLGPPRDMSPADLYQLCVCDPAPRSTLVPWGVGPVTDTWTWSNVMTFLTLKSPRGFEYPHEWGGCVREVLVTQANPSYALYRDGALVAGGALRSYAVTPTTGAGAYRSEVWRPVDVGGVASEVRTVSTFRVAGYPPVDENPPAIGGLHVLARGAWQAAIDPGFPTALRFTVDPRPGYTAQDPSAPGGYRTMPDALASVTVEQGPDLATLSPVDLLDLGGGAFEASLRADPGATLSWIRVSAADQAGNTTSYTFQLPVAPGYDLPDGDVQPPTAEIVSPAGGASVRAGTTVVVAVAASDDVGVARVRLRVDGVVVATDDAAPYELAWDTTAAAAGAHTLEAVAEDLSGNRATSTPVEVTVVRDEAPPEVTLTSPADGARVSDLVTLAATATDDVGVAFVEFLVDGALVGSTSSAPYALAWDAAAAALGAHSVAAAAQDLSGKRTLSTARTVTVVDVVPPVTAVTAPANGGTVSAGKTVKITATASDARGVASVDVLVAGKVLCTDRTAPYSCSWAVPKYKGRTYTIAAVARDGSGNSATSTAVSVTAR